MKKDFIWGVATAAYQIEGAWNEDGKGPSIWDTLTHEEGNVVDGGNGDVACDHYHRYREDVALMAELGVKAYRFSISWPRVLPDGIGKPNEKGLAFYSNLIDELLAHGITPYITLYHWDMPQKLFERGGWLSPDMPQWFGEYARLIGKRLGDRAKNFITINEPQCILGGMNGNGQAPNLKYSLKDRLTATHNLLKAHGTAVKILRETVKDVKIGYAPCGMPVCPKTDTKEDIEAARKAYFSFDPKDPTSSTSVLSDPVMLGDYPKEYYEVYKDCMPDIKSGDMELISQPLDFYCQNIYSAVEAHSENGKPVVDGYPEDSPKTDMEWHIVPSALYWGPKFLYERYRKPIIITENGVSLPDAVGPDGKIHDSNRIDFLASYLKELKRAIADGVKVNGYFYWSFIDNFEWNFGYARRFGLVYVDYTNQKRIPKDSFEYYREMIKIHSEA